MIAGCPAPVDVNGSWWSHRPKWTATSS